MFFLFTTFDSKGTLYYYSRLFIIFNILLVYLSGGTSKNEGTVNVYYNGKWGSICDDSFGTAEATVICRMLGYTG